MPDPSQEPQSEQPQPLMHLIGSFPEQLVEVIKWMISVQLWLYALIAMGLATVLGVVLLDLGVSPTAAEGLNEMTRHFGSLFLAIINLLVPPVVAFSVFVGIVSNSDLRAVRRIGLTAIITYAITTVFAVFLGCVVAALLMPLATAVVDPHLIESMSASVMPPQDRTGPPSVLAIFAELLPEGNLINPFLEGNLLQIITIAVALGIATMAILNVAEGAMVQGAEMFVKLAEFAMGLFLKLLSWSMILVPFATFGFMFDAIVKQGSVSAMLSMVVFAAVVVLGLLVLMTLYALGVRLMRGMTFKQIAVAAREPLLITFSTASSSVAMPYTMKAAEENFGVAPQIARTTVPLGATVNMDGTSVYQVMALVFLISLFGKIAGVAITVGVLFKVGLLIVLYSVGTPGVPGGSIKVIQEVLGLFGIPPDVISLILPMDRLLDMSRSTVNVSGDLFTANVTDKVCTGPGVTKKG
jgi:proton glutamate symport protein